LPDFNKNNLLEEIFTFYRFLGVTPTVLEIKRSLPAGVGFSKSDWQIIVKRLRQAPPLDGKRIGLIHRKLKKLKGRLFLFRFLPFIDFALLSGSLSLGNANKNSDFDIILGCRTGRVFTVRFLAVGLFYLLGQARLKHYSKQESKDRFCFNHFVTPRSYQLSVPRGYYSVQLYRHLIPLYGKRLLIERFIQMNGWAKARLVFDSRIFLEFQPNLAAKALEKLLAGKLGNILEDLLKKIQLRKIKPAYYPQKKISLKSRLVLSDDELEFHIHNVRDGQFEEFG